MKVKIYLYDEQCKAYRHTSSVELKLPTIEVSGYSLFYTKGTTSEGQRVYSTIEIREGDNLPVEKYKDYKIEQIGLPPQVILQLEGVPVPDKYACEGLRMKDVVHYPRIDGELNILTIRHLDPTLLASDGVNLTLEQLAIFIVGRFLTRSQHDFHKENKKDLGVIQIDKYSELISKMEEAYPLRIESGSKLRDYALLLKLFEDEHVSTSLSKTSFSFRRTMKLCRKELTTYNKKRFEGSSHLIADEMLNLYLTFHAWDQLPARPSNVDHAHTARLAGFVAT